MIDSGQGTGWAPRCLADQWMIDGPSPAQSSTIEVTT